MKKLIAISVVFTLLTGVAFAQLSFGGAFHVGTIIMMGDDAEDSMLATKGVAWEEAKLNVGFGDSAAGGKFVLHYDNVGRGHHGGIPFAFGWWQPNANFRMQLGCNWDGDWGAAQITGWGFSAEAKNVVAYNDYGGSRGEGGNVVSVSRAGFYPGIDNPSLNLSFLNLVPGLTINVGIPTAGKQVGESFVNRIANTQLNVVYNVEDIGIVRASYISGIFHLDASDDPADWWENEIVDPGKAFLSFYLTAVDNLGLDIGFAYRFQGKNQEREIFNYPLEIGLGVTYNAGDLNIKFRSGFELGGSTITGFDTDMEEEKNSPVKLAFNILPTYKVGNMTVYLFAGVGIQSVDDYEEAGGIYAANESNAVVDWFVNPYVRIPAGPFSFWAGVSIWSDGVNDADSGNPVVKFAVPIGLTAWL
jgi:hypothetical protein